MPSPYPTHIDPMDPRPELMRNLRELVAMDHELGTEFLPPGVEDALPAASAQPSAPNPEPVTPINTVLPGAPALGFDAQSPCFDAGTGDGPTQLQTIAKAIGDCTACGLCHGRSKTVPGEGDPQAELMFIGEGPGADEDRSGRPFVGAAGQLLEKMIMAMGLKRDQVFIANVIKCRPPGNRNPEPDEMSACLPFLRAQIRAIKPKIICTLGNTPLKALSGDLKRGITRARGTPFKVDGITAIPTFHPSYLLRNESAKKPAWQDLKKVLELLGRELPKRG